MHITTWIQSRQNPTVKEVCALHEKKRRVATGTFYFEGYKLFCEACRRGVTLQTVFVTEAAAARYEEELQALIRDKKDVRVLGVHDAVYQKMSAETAPQGILCVARHIDKWKKCTKIEEIPVTHAHLLLCECIQDPGNLGTVLRTAAAFGYDGVVLSADCADLENPKVLRATMGAAFSLPVYITSDLCEVIWALRNANRIVAAAALHQDAWTPWTMPDLMQSVFVIGSEGQGLRAQTIEACQGCVTIPMERQAESLNAAAAATVLMWEQYRARQMLKQDTGENAVSRS